MQDTPLPCTARTLAPSTRLVLPARQARLRVVISFYKPWWRMAHCINCYVDGVQSVGMLTPPTDARHLLLGPRDTMCECLAQ